MKTKLHLRVLVLLVALSLLLSGAIVTSAAPPAPAAASQFTATPLAGVSVPATDTGLWPYIIRLTGEPLASYGGGVARLQATSPRVTGQHKLNVNSPASQAYVDHLADVQAQFVSSMDQALGRSVKVLHNYRIVYNGVAAMLTADEAKRVTQLRGVVSVQPDELQQPLTDVTPEFIGATSVWDGTAAGITLDNKYDAVLNGDNEVPDPVETDATGYASFTYDPETGELSYTLTASNIISPTMAHIHRGTADENGPVIYWLYDADGQNAPDGDFPVSGTVTISEDDAALLDTGGLYVNVHTTANPAGEIRGQIMPLATKGEGVVVGVIDTGIWPEHPSFADDGTYPPPPESWTGDACDFGNTDFNPDDVAFECNNKLIGARAFLDTYNEVLGYDGLFFSARDDDGHGTHTTSTAAGNENVQSELLGHKYGRVSGMAPRAHVAAYKGLGPQGGFTSDLTAAIEQATADGVDVINYSIGGGASNPWDDADSLAYLAAREAGVFVATSAGNSGPGPDTIGSPANAPWIATVGASTSNRSFISDITVSGPGDPPTGLWGMSVTDGVTEYNLVDAEGIPDSEGDDSGLCLNPFPEGTFESTDVVLCERGQIARVLRGEYVAAGGGGAVILYNPVPDQDLDTDNFIIPAVHVSNEFGLELKDYVDLHPGEVTVSFTQGTETFADEDSRVTADLMAAFSSRGPNGPVPAVIKPDVTAPGVQILAGASPEHEADGNAQGQLFQAIQGTSMSSPHVAGSGALLKALYPDWSPAEIQSALMTTAKTEGVVKEDGTTPADPFDMGSGRIDLTRAADPGLVFDETADGYMAGQDDPANINLSSLGFGNVAGVATISRTATSLVGSDSTWTVTVEAPEGVEITVSPDPLMVPANGTATFTVSVDATQVPEGPYFADVYLEHGPHIVHMPVYFVNVPAVWNPLDNIVTQWDASQVDFELQSGVNQDPFVINAYGLVAPTRTQGGPLEQDPDQDASTDFLGEGFDVYYYTLTSDTLWFVAQTRNSEISDIDLFLVYDANGDGVFSYDEVIDSSTSPSANEEVQVAFPAAGNYAVGVQAWAGSGTYTLKTYDVMTDNLGESLNVLNAPDSIQAANTYPMQVAWDRRIDEGEEYLGLVSMGSSEDATAVGFAPVRVMGDVPAVQKSVAQESIQTGGMADYEVVLTNTQPEEQTYSLVDDVPSNLAVDPASVTGGATVSDGNVTWTGTLPPASDTVEIGPSTTFAVGGYLALADFVDPISTDLVDLDDAYVNFDLAASVSYLGEEYTTVCMVTNGYLVMGGCTSTDDIQFQPQDFPDPDLPNNVIAPMWMDFDLDGGDGVGGGTWYAARLSGGGSTWSVFEWTDAQRWGEEDTAFTFQVWLKEETQEVTLTYGRLDGPMSSSVVGAENADGTAGAVYYYNDGEGTEIGTFPTLDDVLDVSGGFEPSVHTINYSAEGAVAGDATNVATATSGVSRDEASATTTVIPTAPEGRYSLAARVFLDDRCDTFFTDGVDKPMGDVPVTLTFSNGATLTSNTFANGLVLFSGIGVPDEVTVDAQLPGSLRGWALEACRSSQTSYTLSAADFGPFRTKFLTFRLTPTGEIAGP